ncbi:MAG TPA: hypothetical protein VEN29_19675 [Casimicrobiaceae bacterium]|nr:hypothetical protein [Casimicrobiaceae bacterium]
MNGILLATNDELRERLDAMPRVASLNPGRPARWETILLTLLAAFGFSETQLSTRSGEK